MNVNKVQSHLEKKKMNKKWLARARLTKPKFKIRWENQRAADEKSTFECEAQIKHQIIDRISKRRQPAKCKAAAAFHPEIWTPHSNFEPSTSAQETQTKKNPIPNSNRKSKTENKPTKGQLWIAAGFEVFAFGQVVSFCEWA